MSTDRLLDRACPHLVANETLFVYTDQVTIRPIKPISSAASVKVRLSGAIDCPSTGVYLPANTIGTMREPFNIKTGTNNVIQVSVDQGNLQTATLPDSKYMTAHDLVNRLNAQISGFEFYTYNQSQVGIRSRTLGRISSLYISAASTLGTTLGLVKGREYRGKDLIPGWTLIVDTKTLADRPTSLIIFDSPLSSYGDFVEVCYATVQAECRRCGGSGYEHDWQYDTQGQLVLAQNEVLLVQEVQKMLWTTKGSNPFHTWYGTDLIQNVGKNLIPGGMIQNLVVADIYEAFNRWQSIKSQQEQRVGQEVTDKEFPMRLLGVNLQASQKDKAVVFVSVTVQNRSGDPVNLERGVRVGASAGTIQQSYGNYALSG
jgi:hypothetical protein